MRVAIPVAVFLLVLLVACILIVHDILGAPVLLGFIGWGIIVAVMAGAVARSGARTAR